MNKYNVVRLDHSIVDSDGAPHQSHQFSAHRTLDAAIRAAERQQQEFNCVDIVDEHGRPVEWVTL